MLRDRDFRKVFFRYLLSASLFEAAGMFWVTTFFMMAVTGAFAFTGELPPFTWDVLWQVPIGLVVLAVASLASGPFIAAMGWVADKPWRWNAEKLSGEAEMNYALVRRPVPLAVGRLLLAWIRRRTAA